MVTPPSQALFLGAQPKETVYQACRYRSTTNPMGQRLKKAQHVTPSRTMVWAEFTGSVAHFHRVMLSTSTGTCFHKSISSVRLTRSDRRKPHVGKRPSPAPVLCRSVI